MMRYTHSLFATILSFSFASFSILSFSAVSDVEAILAANGDESPLGERADYELDKDPARTSSMILSGSAAGTIDKHVPNHPQGPSYNAALSYDMTVRIYGRYQGVTNLPFVEEFFTPQFMIDLRESRYYEVDAYKMRHDGRATVKTIAGVTYKDCDSIYMYDITPEYKRQWEILLVRAAGVDPDEFFASGRSIENLVIRGYIYPGIKALGTVKLDISGKVKGIAVKIGLDLKK